MPCTGLPQAPLLQVGLIPPWSSEPQSERCIFCIEGLQPSDLSRMAKLYSRAVLSLLQGDWRGISQQFVTTRTPTQVASHAQKHFIRRTNAQSHKRRSSLFDMDSDFEQVQHQSERRGVHER